MSEIIVNVKGQTCPVPLVEFRKAVMRANKGDIIIIIGTHAESKQEIPIASKSMGLNILQITDNNEQWIIKVKI